MKLATLCMGQASGPFPLYGNYLIHDPGTLIKNGNSYFIYGDGQGISALTSTDLRNWTAASTVFPANNPPAWTTNNIAGFTGYFWAPDIAYFNGQYNLYYACSQWGTINSAIGLVTSPSLTSPVWTDQGKVIESNYPATTNSDTTAYNCFGWLLVPTHPAFWSCNWIRPPASGSTPVRSPLIWSPTTRPAAAGAAPKKARVYTSAAVTIICSSTSAAAAPA
jgi:hypothetical protein